jgi:hypothetical protein
MISPDVFGGWVYSFETRVYPMIDWMNILPYTGGLILESYEDLKLMI